MKLKLLLTCLGAIVGGSLWGVSISSEIGSEAISINELVPPEMKDKFPESGQVALSKRINIIVSPFRVAIGGTIGGIIGFVLSFVMRKWKLEKNISNVTKAEQRSSLSFHNLKVLLILLCSVIAMWFAFYVAILRFRVITEPLDSIKFGVAFQFAGFLAIICSWLLVCKKFIWSKKWARKKRMLMLGPFSFKKIPLMNDKQLKALWLTVALMLFSFLFPPWIVYEAAFGNVGTGKPIFAGFHFILSPQQSVLVDSPYILAEISNEMLVLWELFLLVLSVVLVVIFGIKGQTRTQNVPIKTDDSQ